MAMMMALGCTIAFTICPSEVASGASAETRAATGNLEMLHLYTKHISMLYYYTIQTSSIHIFNIIKWKMERCV
jgi:hypothetical protein